MIKARDKSFTRPRNMCRGMRRAFVICPNKWERRHVLKLPFLRRALRGEGQGVQETGGSGKRYPKAICGLFVESDDGDYRRASERISGTRKEAHTGKRVVATKTEKTVRRRRHLAIAFELVFA